MAAGEIWRDGSRSSTHPTSSHCLRDGTPRLTWACHPGFPGVALQESGRTRLDCGRNQAWAGLGAVTQHQRFCCGSLLDCGAWRGGFARLEFVAQDEDIARSFDADSHLVSRDFYDGYHD